MDATQISEPATSLIQRIGQEGTFAVGVLLGCIVSGFMYWLASGERKEFVRLLLEREKELSNQLKLRDERINKLHDELGKAKGIHHSAKPAK